MGFLPLGVVVWGWPSGLCHGSLALWQWLQGESCSTQVLHRELNATWLSLNVTPQHTHLWPQHSVPVVMLSITVADAE